MRCSRSGVAGLVALMALVTVLLSGCELREGAKSEYGESSGVHGQPIAKIANQELPR